VRTNGLLRLEGSKSDETAASGVLLEEVSSPTAVIRINDFAIH
jgi:hypothetical protein